MNKQEPRYDAMDEVGLDFMLVADGAQAVGGKLYMLGGGWTHLFIPEFPGRAPLPFYVALGLRIPWNRTNQRFAFKLEMQDADGQAVSSEPAAHGEFEQGRPPGLKAGSAQRVMLAVPIGADFPEPGQYVFAAFVDEKEVGRTMIDVLAPLGVPA